MAQSSSELHEDAAALKPDTIDRHRALISLMEELEAMDWYDQRVDATGNAELQAILTHNRDEEKEHASMILEWLRRHDQRFDEQLRSYLFTERELTAIKERTEADETQSVRDGSLDIGDLRVQR